jgi:hypothetical protein
MSQPSREDFELEQPYEQLASKTLETVIAEGESDWEKEQEIQRISVHTMPIWVASVLINLKRRHKNAPTVAAVERLTAKLGIAVMRDRFGKPMAEVESLRQEVFELINQFLLRKIYREAGTYELEETVGVIYRKCSLRPWVVGAITDYIVDALGLSSSTAVSLTLIAGIAQSETWVPRGWVELANKELAHFQKYLEEEAKRLIGRKQGWGKN